MLRYRGDIDGLRGVAVLSVLLFHARLAGASGGFVGVDIFFVISGFLISSILLQDVETGAFSLARFYDRRIRRILPAYAAVAVASIVAACLLLPPGELDTFGRRLASTAVFASNFLFRSETNYFGPAAADNPLLHTWSLSVEEQFYVVWPLAMAALASPRFVRFRKWLVVLGLAASFAAASVMAVTRPATAFYQTPLRAWELLLGASLALGLVPQVSRFRGVVAAVAAALLLVPVFTYRSAVTVFPGLGALPPCLGAALLIHLHARHRTWASRLLSTPALVHVGLISYSLYLWHWPLLCFARLYLLRDLRPLEAAAVLVVSFACAELSWRFVERPFRGHHKGLTPGLPRSIPVGVGVLAALLVVGAALDAGGGWPGRAAPGAVLAAQERARAARGVPGCHIGVESTRLRTSGCLLGATDEGAASAVLLGDSHAAAYAPAVAELGLQGGFAVRQWTKSSCAPLLEPGDQTRRLFQGSRAEASCRAFTRKALAAIGRDARIRTVFIAGYWSNLGGDEEGGIAPPSPSSEAWLQARLEPVVAELVGHGKTVVLLGQTPVFPTGGGVCVIRSRFRGLPDAACGASAEFERAVLAPSDRALSAIAGRHPAVRYFQGSSAFCERGRCVPVAAGHVVMRDEHHLNWFGSMALVPAIASATRGAPVG